MQAIISTKVKKFDEISQKSMSTALEVEQSVPVSGHCPLRAHGGNHGGIKLSYIAPCYSLLNSAFGLVCHPIVSPVAKSKPPDSSSSFVPTHRPARLLVVTGPATPVRVVASPRRQIILSHTTASICHSSSQRSSLVPCGIIQPGYLPPTAHVRGGSRSRPQGRGF